MNDRDENVKVNPITLTDSETGAKYVLEFSRESVKFAEIRGFAIEDVQRYPMTKIPELFFYAFRKNHKNISRQKTDAFLDEWGGIGGIPDGMIERLVALYIQPFEATPQHEGAVKNARLTVEF